MKKYLVILLILSMVFGLFAACGEKQEEGQSPQTAVKPVEAALTFATSYEQVYQSLIAAKEAQADVRVFNDAIAESSSPTADANLGSNEGSDVVYSGTNVQVQGVDEGDIVKTDGVYMYILRDCELIVMQANGAEVTEVSHTIVGEEWDSSELEDGGSRSSEKKPRELYLIDDRAVVISTYYDWMERAAENVRTDAAADVAKANGTNYVTVDIYDISDPAEPKLVKSLGQDGYQIASRMMNGVLYLCTSYYVNQADEEMIDTYIPRLYTDGKGSVVDCGTIGLMPYDDAMVYTVLVSYDIAAGSVLNSQSILGGGETVYMNTQNLYLSRSVYEDGASEPYKEDNYTVTDYHTSVSTTISRFSVADGKLTYAATGTAAGALLNQFSMDEQDGYLRLVTTEETASYSIYVDEARDFENYDWHDDRKTSNDLFVLDSDLRTVGSVTGLAEDEQIYSARFDGDYGYLCTYRTVDPIFALNLSDPANPTVTGALKLPGYSDYLHVWSDGLLFGLGMNTQEVQTGGETTATLDGMKMIMVNTSDPAALTEQHSMDIDADYSEALYNHKAILVDSGRNLIAFPAEGSYLVYRYDPEAGFQLAAEISVSEWDWNNRGLYIGNYFYVVGSDYVNVLDMDTLENVGQTLISRG